VGYEDQTGCHDPAGYHKQSVRHAVTKGQIKSKHHAYTLSNYSRCYSTGQLEHLLRDDDRNTNVGSRSEPGFDPRLGILLILNQYHYNYSLIGLELSISEYITLTIV
jgi:hypothetical protein